MQPKRIIVLLGAALVVGLSITWLDSRPAWDDTGITAGLIVLASAAFGAARPRWAWLWALAIGAWIPLLGVFNHNYAALLALAIALCGAYAGAFVRVLSTRQQV